MYNDIHDKKIQIENEPFVYTDAEIGQKGIKVSAGIGSASYIGGMGGRSHIGLGYAKLDSEDLVFINFRVFVLILGLNANVYRNNETKEYLHSIGIEIGF